MKITNTTEKTPAGVHTHAGLVFVEPGQTIEADVTGAELESAKMAGHFDFEGDAKELAKPAPAESPKAKAKHQGAGKWSVVKGDDVLVSGLDGREAADQWMSDNAED